MAGPTPSAAADYPNRPVRWPIIRDTVRLPCRAAGILIQVNDVSRPTKGG
jgi:hypothetical protein